MSTKTNYLDLSGKLDRVTVEILRTIADRTTQLDIPFFVAGATARDVVLKHGYGIRPTLATVDIDVGVMVGSWNKYEELRKALLGTGLFGLHGNRPHCLVYRNTVPIDLLPFGAVQTAGATIAWPPDHTVKMSVLGFSEAYAAALRVQLSKDLQIRFASLAGLTLMKLIAWRDRASGKDAKDLALLMSSYADAGNIERLHDDYEELLTTEEFDYAFAGARLLGKDVAAVASKEAKAAVVDILNVETDESGDQRLVTAMSQDRTEAANFERDVTLLARLKAGVCET